MLVEDERLALLSFTGGLVGWDLKARAGRKKVTLELGGNAACIVDADPGQPLDSVVKLEVPNETIIGRCEIRYAAEHRKDDDPAVVRDRLKVYAEQTAPVADFYAQRGKLQVVDGVGELDEVTARVKHALKAETAAANG